MKRIVCLIVMGWLAAARAPAAVPATAPATQPEAVTFFLTSDTHFGAKGMDQANRTMVEQMNDLPGTAYPESVGGAVGVPRAVLNLGDLTDNGTMEEFDQFVQVFGLTGREGLLKYPVFETAGNHDLVDDGIAQRVRQRHGGLPYSWDWAGVHFVMLGMYPDEEGLNYLETNLSQVGDGRPVILCTHYPMAGPHSESWSAEQKEAFARVIAGYNVVAIFHGHYHSMGKYRWKDHNVLRPGAPRHNSHQFIVAQLAEGKLSVCWWDWDKRRWAGQALIKDLVPATQPATGP